MTTKSPLNPNFLNSTRNLGGGAGGDKRPKGALARARTEAAAAERRAAQFKSEVARLRARNDQIEAQLNRLAPLPVLVRAHRAAVEDGVGNWGNTEAALFAAVK